MATSLSVQNGQAMTNYTSTPARKTDLDKDAFLTLLVTQLKNQDPLSPLRPDEFAAQLAQFTTVEKLTELNTAVGDQNQIGQLSLLMGQTSFSASLLGRHIVSEGDRVVVPSSGAATVRIDVAGAGGQAKLTLKDDAGKVVATRDLGSLKAGRQNVALPNDLPPGTYHYSVDVTGVDQKVVAAKTYTIGTVDSIDFKDGKIVLHVGAFEIGMDTIAEISP